MQRSPLIPHAIRYFIHHTPLPLRCAVAMSASATNKDGAAAWNVRSSSSPPLAHPPTHSPTHSPTHPTPLQANQTQEEFMKHDAVILVDPADTITGHASKYTSHRFESPTPTGLLHRAFSVFLFDQNNRLLLQQRAASKITFDSVWTNTCCSHPLWSDGNANVNADVNSEVDDVDAVVATGTAPGAARAAIRKLQHELGIDPGVFATQFTFLTRLHYCAKDQHNPEWGEHEMDYILFHRLPCDGADLPMAPHPDEVGDTRWVTKAELAEMMREGNGLRWSHTDVGGFVRLVVGASRNCNSAE